MRHRLLLVLLLPVVLAGCPTYPPVTQPVEPEPTDGARFALPEAPVAGPDDPVVLRESQDAFDLVYQVEVADGETRLVEVVNLPEAARQREKFARDKPAAKLPEERRSKLHPLLERWLAEGRGDERERLVVTFRDDLVIPRFPEPDIEGGRRSPDSERALRRAEAIVAELAAERREGYGRWAKLLSSYEGEVVETFWLVPTVVVEMPIAAVRELAVQEDVVSIEPEQTEDSPPQNSNDDDDVADGRASLQSDPYFSAGLASGWIGLLDTGVRDTHVQFNSPDHLAFLRDCVNGGSSCASGTLNTTDDCWNHGTRSAGILTGNSRQGNAFRGVTEISVDSWKVYPSTFDSNGRCTGGLNTTATLRAFERAVAVLDRVIVAEMQGGGDDLSSISLAADNAFDAGSIVIAANGNNGPGAETVNVPAIAHRVIGVGNFDLESGNAISSQSRGATPDDRIKPDIQTPTNSETASNGCGFGQDCRTGGSDTALARYGGTSGATPYAAAAAALFRNWMRRFGSIDPGHVYARLILSGQRTNFDNTRGTGPVRMPVDGFSWWGKVSIRDGETIDIPLPVTNPAAHDLDGALWWPERPRRFLFWRTDVHNDVDLYLIDPSGRIRASSVSIPSVFERARAAGSVSTGTWRLRIRGYDVDSDRQTVYYGATVRN